MYLMYVLSRVVSQTVYYVLVFYTEGKTGKKRRKERKTKKKETNKTTGSLYIWSMLKNVHSTT